MNTFSKVLLFSLLPVITILTGGIIALIKKPGGSFRSVILHFAAGVVFSVVGVEILPDVIKNHLPLMTIIGFVLGFAVMAGIRQLMEGKEEKQTTIASSGALPYGLLTGIGVDILIDGLLLGIGFAAGETEGILLAIALAVELLSLGMATTTELGDNNVNKKKSIGVIIGLALIFFISAVLGATLLSNLSHNAMDVVLSFGLAALLFLVTEELLTEAHEEKETILHTSAFFGGFLAFVILGMYV